jgi:hypothetical protein
MLQVTHLKLSFKTLVYLFIMVVSRDALPKVFFFLVISIICIILR